MYIKKDGNTTMADLTLEHRKHQVKRKVWATIFESQFGLLQKGDPNWLSLSHVTTHDAIKGCGGRVMNNNTGARGWLLWVRRTILRERGRIHNLNKNSGINAL